MTRRQHGIRTFPNLRLVKRIGSTAHAIACTQRMHPVTTRDVLKRRLAGCDVEEPSLYDLLPYDASGEHEEIYNFLREYLAAATSAVLGMINPFDIDHNYQFRENGRRIIEQLESST